MNAPPLRITPGQPARYVFYEPASGSFLTNYTLHAGLVAGAARGPLLAALSESAGITRLPAATGRGTGFQLLFSAEQTRHVARPLPTAITINHALT